MNPIEENLVGYLVGALDELARLEVESYLRTNPAARARLQRLRGALAPLRADPNPQPPPGLAQRTLAHVAKQRARSVPSAPRVSIGDGGGTGWGRRSELLVASVLGLVMTGLLLVYFLQRQKDYGQQACAENLRALHNDSLTAFSDLRHDHAFPRIEAQGHRSTAGMFVPILADAGVLTADVNLSCPASSERPAHVSADMLKNLEGWYRTDRDRYLRTVRELGACYAYSLGYREGDTLVGLRAGAGNDHLPLLADRPPFEARGDTSAGNSANHAGRGQNVLFVDGSVRFITNRTIGAGNDDIYLNQRNRVLAGVHSADCVLACGDASP